MTTLNEKLEAKKLELKDVFSIDRFYEIPAFQRRFSWEKDNFDQLIEDLWEAFSSGKDYYFLGSIVLSKKGNNVYRIIDGQQRLTSLSILYAVLREFVDKEEHKNNLLKKIYSPKDELDNIPEKFRINFEIEREELSEYKDIIKKYPNINVNNIKYEPFKKAIESFKDFLKDKNNTQQIIDFIQFLNRKTYMVEIVSQEDDTAINIFHIINSRGLPLSNVDLIKSKVYSLLNNENEEEKNKYMEKWETLERDFSDERYSQSEFELIINFIRAYYKEDKARKSLYKEIEDILDKEITAKDFLKKLENLSEMYEGLIKNLDLINNFNVDNETKVKIKNYIILLREFYPSSEWISAVIFFYDKFKENNFFEFLFSLERKLYLDWLTQKSPTERLRPIYDVIKNLKANKSEDEIIKALDKELPKEEDVKYHLNSEDFYRRFRGALARYTLLKLEYSEETRNRLENFHNITVEHIFPKKPSETWKGKFGENFEKYVDKLGNLTLVDGKLNSSMKNKPFKEKIQKIKEKKEFNLNKELEEIDDWNLEEFEKRHKRLVNKLFDLLKLNSGNTGNE